MVAVEKMIDRVSGVLNLALANSGFVTPVVNTTAKLSCDDWVTDRVTEYVELTQRGVGYSDGEGSRATYFRNLQKGANDFVGDNRKGFIILGVGVGHSLSEGLQFTGMQTPVNRPDVTNVDLEQPEFTRRQGDDLTERHFTYNNTVESRDND
jgi:hypothetical protein